METTHTYIPKPTINRVLHTLKAQQIREHTHARACSSNHPRWPNHRHQVGPLYQTSLTNPCSDINAKTYRTHASSLGRTRPSASAHNTTRSMFIQRFYHDPYINAESNASFPGSADPKQIDTIRCKSRLMTVRLTTWVMVKNKQLHPEYWTIGIYVNEGA